jgi:large repetitive protein
MAFQQYPQKLGIPSGTTAQRPTSPVIGDTFYNGNLEILEIWNGTSWVAVSAPPATPSISTPTDSGSTNAYTSNGALTVVFTPGSGGGTPNQYNAYTTAGGFSASSSGTTVTLTGLTPGTAYTVYGTAQNNFGTTVNTANAAAVTATTKPQAPTIGTATASTNSNVLTVAWTLNSTGGKNLSAITITPYRNGTTAETSRTAATTSSTTHTFTGLTSGSAYTFKVKTTNANGTSLESSATNSITVPTFITVDYLVIAGGGGAGGGQAGQGVGGAGGAGGYRTSAGTSGANSAAETALSVLSDTNYTVTVGAGGAGGTGSW